MRRLRIYSETAAYAAVGNPVVLAALAVRNLELVLAVRPWDLAELPATAARVTDAGVIFSLWPMLADDDGRFLHVGNVARFGELTRRALDACQRVPVRDVLFDLEPPVAVLRAARRGDWAMTASVAARGLRGHVAANHAAERLRCAVEEWGASVTAAVIPTVLWEGGTSPMSRALGTVSAAGFGACEVMAYSTLFEELSFGAFDRRDATAMLAEVARQTAARTRAGRPTRMALGCVGLGALGDERVFADPSMLAHDVAIVRGCGVDDLTLLDLGGVLARPPIEAWLDALVLTEAALEADIPRTWRARTATSVLERLRFASLSAFGNGR